MIPLQDLFDLSAEGIIATTQEADMHTGPINIRDRGEDWKEVEECLVYIELQNPTHAEYVEWLESNEYVEQDLDAFHVS